MTFGKIFGWLSAVAAAFFVAAVFATILQGAAERRAAREKHEAQMSAIREAAQKRTSAMQINYAQIQQIVEKIAATKPIPTGQVSKKDPTPKVTNADMDRFYDAKMVAMLELIRVANGMCPDPKVDVNELNQVVASTIWEEGVPKLCNGIAPYPGFPEQRCHVSPVGCRGLTQICAAFAEDYGIDADGDGTVNVDTMADAVFSTANFYCKSGGATDKAILTYNHSTDYRDKIRRGMERYGKLFANAPAPEALVATAEPTPVADDQPVVLKPVPEGCTRDNRGNTFCPNGGQTGIKYFAAVPLREHLPWTSSWGDRRRRTSDDGKRYYVPHGGFDLGCNRIGQSSFAFCSGKITLAADGVKLAGSMMVLECDDGLYKGTYEHMLGFTAKKGDTVAADQKIAECGQSGNAMPGPGQKDDPHVHFQLARKDPSAPGGWVNVNPCAGKPGRDTILHCDQMFGPNTRFNEIREVPIASNP